MADQKKSPEYTGTVHHYDDIEEHDNHLPTWWLWTLFGAIIFSVGYFFHYEIFKTGLNPQAAFDKEMEVKRAAEAEALMKSGAVTPESLMKLAQDKGTVAKGAELYQTNCASCHKDKGQGEIGPNLTDRHWLHGGAPDKVYKSIKEGILAKGMPAWGAPLGHDKTLAVTAFVLSIKNTEVPGKAPQGQKE